MERVRQQMGDGQADAGRVGHQRGDEQAGVGLFCEQVGDVHVDMGLVGQQIGYEQDKFDEFISPDEGLFERNM